MLDDIEDNDISEINNLDVHRTYPMDTDDESKLIRIIYSLAKRIVLLEAEKKAKNG